MEAFSYYEDGLKTAKEIQVWDYLYGSIWRELNLARFFDKTSLNNLLKYRDKSKEMGYRYLVALSDTFYIISSYLLNDINVDTLLELYQEVMSMDMPGLILESSITMMTLSLIDIDEELVTSLLSLAQGIKGYPQIVSIFFKKYYDQLSKSTRDMLDNWIDIHVKEIIE